MTAKRPVFRVMKNGYDRFAVDDAIESYMRTIEELENKLLVYQQQLQEYRLRIQEVEGHYKAIQDDLALRQAAADDIARLSLREANEIIASAKHNGDTILKEAIASANMILQDLNHLVKNARDMKGDMKVGLANLQKEIDALALPNMPDLKWLEDTKDKLQ